MAFNRLSNNLQNNLRREKWVHQLIKPYLDGFFFTKISDINDQLDIQCNTTKELIDHNNYEKVIVKILYKLQFMGQIEKKLLIISLNKTCKSKVICDDFDVASNPGYELKSFDEYPLTMVHVFNTAKQRAVCMNDMNIEYVIENVLDYFINKPRNDHDLFILDETSNKMSKYFEKSIMFEGDPHAFVKSLDVKRYDNLYVLCSVNVQNDLLQYSKYVHFVNITYNFNRFDDNFSLSDKFAIIGHNEKSNHIIAARISQSPNVEAKSADIVMKKLAEDILENGGNKPVTISINAQGMNFPHVSTKELGYIQKCTQVTNIDIESFMDKVLVDKKRNEHESIKIVENVYFRYIGKKLYFDAYVPNAKIDDLPDLLREYAYIGNLMIYSIDDAFATFCKITVNIGILRLSNEEIEIDKAIKFANISPKMIPKFVYNTCFGKLPKFHLLG